MNKIVSPHYNADNGVVITLFERRPAPYAEGGLASLAEHVRRGGRGDDEILLHISPEEFDWLRQEWGEPDINPITGLPEYGWLSKLWKKVKKGVKSIVKSPIFQAVAPMLLNFFVPGAGAAIGGALGASGTAASVLGNAAIGAGLGAAGGGGKGALSGALMGGIAGGGGKMLGSAVGLKGPLSTVAGNALLSGAASSARGGDFGKGALIGGGLTALGNMGGKYLKGTPAEKAFGLDSAPGSVAGAGAPELGPVIPTGAGLYRMDQYGAIPDSGITAASVGASPLAQAAGASPSLLSRVGSYVKENPLQSALMLGTLVNSSKQYDEPGDAGPPELPPGFTEALPQLDFNRTRTMLTPEEYYTYGQTQPEHQFFADNVLPQLPGRARGGRAPERSGDSHQGARLVRGPGTGRSDDIPAVLSDGEYVMDAETVALLGDGSTDEGARRLDEMRKNLRKHKAKNLSKGGFSHAAKSPEEYLRLAKGGKVKAAVKKVKVPFQFVLNHQEGEDIADDLKRLFTQAGLPRKRLGELNWSNEVDVDKTSSETFVDADLEGPEDLIRALKATLGE